MRCDQLRRDRQAIQRNLDHLWIPRQLFQIVYCWSSVSAISAISFMRRKTQKVSSPRSLPSRGGLGAKLLTRSHGDTASMAWLVHIKGVRMDDHAARPITGDGMHQAHHEDDFLVIIGPHHDSFCKEL